MVAHRVAFLKSFELVQPLADQLGLLKVRFTSHTHDSNMTFIANMNAHTGAHKNPDGTWVCGGAHTGAHKNPDGTWVCS